MANILDYLEWRGDLDFKKAKFNEIDSLILSRFSYFPLDGLLKNDKKITEFYKLKIYNCFLQ